MSIETADMAVSIPYFAVALSAIVVYVAFKCKHAWEFVDKTQLPSKIEVLSKTLHPEKMPLAGILEVSKVCATVIVRCPKCGACKVIRMSNED